MEIQLQELIDKIKKDGVANAEQAAAQIIAEAEKKVLDFKLKKGIIKIEEK